MTKTSTVEKQASRQAGFQLVASLLDAVDRPLLVTDRRGQLLFTNLHAQDVLVQLPVFVALYNVLFNAIELRQAPFVGWIHDLSAPDLLFAVGPFPVRLLPLLMLGSGLLSQRFTPSDPRQLPTMYMMNAFMTVFFYNLPSGLVLYWTLMNVLTAVQQWIVLRQHGGSSAVVIPAVPEPQPKARKR